MKRKFLCLLLALTMVLGLAATVSAAVDSTGRYALNNNDYTHAYVVKGDILDAEFRYNTVDAPCASPVWLFKASLTGKETQAELDQLAYDLLTSGKEPLSYDSGWTHSLNTNRQSQRIETAELELGSYLIVAAAMSDHRYCCDGDTTVHYETATGVGLHVVEKAVPIETFEYWYCDANGNEVQQLTAEEAFIISHENDSPLYRFKIKTYPENATERVIDLTASDSTEEYYSSLTAIPGFSFEDGMYGTCAQNCGIGYFWLVVDSFGENEASYNLCHNISFEVPCHQDGPIKVQEWYTCTEPGYKCAYCYGYGETCDTIYGYEILDPPGHTLKEVYEVITAPTATKTGLGIGLCKNCLSRGVEGHIPAIFSDVKPNEFYSDALDYGYACGWVNGATETTFNPGGQCLRAQVVTFLWRAEGCPEPETAVNPFVDVKESDFYYKAVLWAVENGITNGADATHFNPMGVCNRAQVVTFLHRAKNAPAPESMELPFTDVPAESWYAAPVAWAVENSVTNGMSATEFAPNAPCNRAQVVTFLYRAKDIPKADPVAAYTFELRSNDPTEEIGYVFCEGTEFAAGESVIFYAEPWYGYLVEFTAEPDVELELYYLGACTYELVMPAHDVVLTANFVPAPGEAHFINTTCENGEFFALCDFDEDLRDFAKAGEFVQFYVMPDEGCTLTPENIALTVGGEPWENWWFLGELVEEIEGTVIDGIFLFEAVMPEGDLEVSITCTPGTEAASAQVRVPVSVN